MELYHKKLIVWQKAFELAKVVYWIVRSFPQDEKFILGDQMKRCSISIPSNIAEGSSRGSVWDYVRFLNIAKWSASELETQLLLGKDLNLIKEYDFTQAMELLEEIIKILSTLITKQKIK